MGSNANLPMLSGTLDRLLYRFGLLMITEFARLLKVEVAWFFSGSLAEALRSMRGTA